MKVSVRNKMHLERMEGEESIGWSQGNRDRITSSLTQEETVRCMLATE